MKVILMCGVSLLGDLKVDLTCCVLGDLYYEGTINVFETSLRHILLVQMITSYFSGPRIITGNIAV